MECMTRAYGNQWRRELCKLGVLGGCCKDCVEERYSET